MGLFSIGYATKPFATFIDQVKSYSIDVVADVRSTPFSKVFYDYHQTALEKSLPVHSIRYVHLGNELGPRSKDPSHYDQDGQVQFDRIQTSELFLQGIKRLRTGLDKNLNIALLWAEKDPATCHRSLLVSHYLVRNFDIEIQHISHEGTLESQGHLEERLVSIQSIKEDLLTPQSELQQLAYKRQLEKTSYRK